MRSAPFVDTLLFDPISLGSMDNWYSYVWVRPKTSRCDWPYHLQEPVMDSRHMSVKYRQMNIDQNIN